MTHKVTVRFGGASDSEVHDYSSKVRNVDGTTAPLIHGGMQADNGSPGMGELILDDEDNDIPHRTEPPGLQLAAHNQLIWSEDSPGYDAWLSIGRIDNKNVGRPYTNTAGVNRQWTVQWADANIDLDGLTLTADEVRPTESDVDRVLYFLGAFCNGDPRLTTVFQTHLVSSDGSVTMPAQTYPAGTELVEVFDDCASLAGKMYSVVIHASDDEDHTCFLYIDEEDHTTYPCTLSISDVLSEVDGETVFEPHWRQGGATIEAGQELITGMVSRYGADTDATAVVTDSDHADLYDYWVKPFNDDLSVTAAQATARVTAMVHSQWNEHVTHQPSILIPARLHHLLRAGMSIVSKSSAMMGGQYLGTEQTRRIAAIEWAHAGWGQNGEPLLWANLQLDRTPRKLPLSNGKAQPAATSPKPPSGSCDDVTSTLAPEDFDGETLHSSTHWYSGGTDVNPQNTDPHSGSWSIFWHSTINPWAGYSFSGTWVAGTTYTVGFWTKVDAGAAPCTFYLGAAGAASSSPMLGDSVSLVVGAETVWTYHEMVWTPASTIVSDGLFGSAGVKLHYIFGASSTDGVGFDDGTVMQCSDAEPPPASDDDTGDPGSPDTGCFSPCDHKHPVQTAAVTPVTDAGAYFTGTNQEAVDQEIGAELADHESRIATLETAPGASALDDLSDVTITIPATAERLRYNGTAWVNSALIWRPAMTFDGTNWQVAVDGAGNAVMTEA